jgi:hypothetical protein
VILLYYIGKNKRERIMRKIRLLFALPFILVALLIAFLANILIKVNTGLSDIVLDISVLIALIADNIMGRAAFHMNSRSIKEYYEKNLKKYEEEKYDKLYYEMKRRENRK